MKVIEDAIESVVVKLYGDKAQEFLVSSKMLVGSHGYDGIDVLHILRSSHDKKTFDFRMKKELLKPRTTDFYHFSLLMSQYFGVYNLYCYMMVDRDVIFDVMRQEPTVEKTLEFFKKNGNRIYEYFNFSYGISREYYDQVVSKMFQVNDDYSIYNNDIVFDIGKILMGNDLYQLDHHTSSFLGCSSSIAYFEKRNQLKENSKRF